MAIPHTSIPIHAKCAKDGHAFTEVFKSDDFVVMPTTPPDTEVYRTFLCVQCGDTIRRHVATWRNFVPTSKKTHRS